MKDYSWWLTDHHNWVNHSNYLVCDRANTQSVTVRKVVKLQLNYCNALVIKWIYNIVLFGGKNAGCSFFITFIDVYVSLTLVSDGRLQWPRLRNSDPFCSRAMLICSIIWLGKRRCGLLFCGFCSSLTWGCPVFSASLICIVWSCFYVVVDADQLIRYLRHNWLFDVVWYPRTLWYVDDNHYHFYGSFPVKKRYQKKHRRVE